jgi:hypothetical protein
MTSKRRKSVLCPFTHISSKRDFQISLNERRERDLCFMRSNASEVTTTDGKTRPFWERNLRLMTDSSENGQTNGAPAIVPAGMLGDRAVVIFAAPEEIAKMIEPQC